MKKSSVLVLILSIICITATISYSQEYWAKTYGGGTGYDRATAVQQTSDNGYIVAGYTDSFGAGNADIWLLKLDSSGIVQWQKTYGGTDIDAPWSVQQTSDNGYIVAGYTDSFGAGNADIWLLKLDSSGIVQWQKTYGGIADDYAFSVQQTSDNGYIVAGSTYSFGAGNDDIWLLKLDSSGIVQWQKTYGGTSTQYALSVQQTSDDGHIIAGCTYSVGTDSRDMWLLKLDSSGIIQWQKTYGGTDWDIAYSVEQTSDNGYIVAGDTDSFGAGLRDMWLLKLDSSGIVQWQKTYGGTDIDAPWSVQQTSDNGYIIAGNTFSFGAGGNDGWLLKLDSSGNVQWQKTYGGTDWDHAWSVRHTSDNGYIVAGYTDFFGTDNKDIWLLKLDSSGNIPDCNIIGSSDALVTDTTVVGVNTSITAVDSSAIKHQTSVIPQDISCTVTEVCADDTDTDKDGIPDSQDNCPATPNSLQEDTYPPQRNNIGDACDCECDFDCSGGVDANDVTAFLGDFGRSTYNNPCTNASPCNGDVDCNGSCDADDVSMFLQDFGRSQFNNPCPTCVTEPWCVYP
jgi:hypothetical protein